MRIRGACAVATVALLTLAVAACGDDDAGGGVSAEAKPYVDALEEQMKSDESSDLELTDSQAECLAPMMINAIGVDTLKAKGIEPEEMDDDDSDFEDLDLNETQAGSLYDSFGACKVDIRGLFLDGLSEDSEMSADDRKCVDENLDDALLKQIMVVEFTKGEDALQDDQELMGKLLGVFSKCPGAISNG